MVLTTDPKPPTCKMRNSSFHEYLGWSFYKKQTKQTKLYTNQLNHPKNNLIHQINKKTTPTLLTINKHTSELITDTINNNSQTLRQSQIEYIFIPTHLKQNMHKNMNAIIIKHKALSQNAYKNNTQHKHPTNSMKIETTESYQPISRPKRQRTIPPEELEEQLTAEIMYEESMVQLNAIIPEYINEQEILKLIANRIKEGSKAHQCTTITTRETPITMLGHEVLQVQVIIQTKRRYSAALKKAFLVPSTTCPTINYIKFFEPSEIKSMYKLASIVPYQTEMTNITTELVQNTLLSQLRNHTHLTILFPTANNIKIVIILILLRNEKETKKFTDHEGSPIFFRRNAKGSKFTIISVPKPEEQTHIASNYKKYFKEKETQEQQQRNQKHIKKNIMETQTPQQTTSVTPAIQDMQIGNSILTQTQTYVRTYLNEHHHLHPSRPNCNNNKFNFLQIFLQLITYNSSQNFNQVWSIQIAAHPDTTSKLEINIPEHINQPLDKKIPLYPKTYQQ